eukprot:GILK01005919.1.p1 GENE.GILK01005919.1~~GILK01005919.1.p1  ORF type:complete len:306 (+),score=33.22 GILK01005919.1:44-919(+)
MKSRGFAVVTGAGSGIGHAITITLLQHNIRVLAVGRRLSALAELSRSAPLGSHLHTVSADIATDEGRKQVASAVPMHEKVNILIHSAGSIGCMKAMKELCQADLEQVMAVNVYGPLFLTSLLLPVMEKGARVLHLSSGAAHRPITSWGPYCITKSALFQVYQCYKMELYASQIYFASVRPGMVDTPFQETARNVRNEHTEFFASAWSHHRLIAPATVAKFLYWLLHEVSPDEFTCEEWDIRDPTHHYRWKDGTDIIPDAATAMAGSSDSLDAQGLLQHDSTELSQITTDSA